MIQTAPHARAKLLILTQWRAGLLFSEAAARSIRVDLRELRKPPCHSDEIRSTFLAAASSFATKIAISKPGPTVAEYRNPAGGVNPRINGFT